MIYDNNDIMTMTRIFLFVLLSMLTVTLAHADEHDKNLPKLPKQHPTGTFINALVHAYKTNATLQEKAAEQKVVAEQVPLAKSGWRPTISASGSVTRSRTDRDGPTPTGTTLSTTTQGSVTASQNVFRSGGTVAAVSKAENEVLAGFADYTNTEQSVLLEAATAYLELFAAEEVYKLNLKNEKVLAELLKITRTQTLLGEKSATDVANAESKLAEAITRRIAAKANLETRKGTYFRVIGLHPPSVLTLPRVPKELVPENEGETISLSMIHNPTILNADYNYRANKEDIGVQRANLLPTVDLQASAAKTVAQGSNNILGNANARTRDYSAKATVTVPLYQAGSAWATLRQTRARATQFKVTLEKTRRAVREAAVRAWEDWVSARLRIEQFKIQIKSARINLEGVRSEFKEGTRIFTEVFEAENDLFNAQVNLENAKKDLYVAAYTLLSLVGKMTATDLKLPVEKYDIQGHYKLVKDKWLGLAG